MASVEETDDAWATHPDFDGPKPEGMDDRDWAICLWREEGITLDEIADRLNYSSGGAVSRRITKMRKTFGPEFLSKHSSARPKRKDTGYLQGGLARAKHWEEIRRTAGAKFGQASVEAADLAIDTIRRYAEDPDLRESLDISDARTLAGIAKDLGKRADDMVGSLPHEQESSGGDELFAAMDSAIETGTTRAILRQIEIVVERANAVQGEPLDIPPPSPEIAAEVEAGVIDLVVEDQ